MDQICAGTVAFLASELFRNFLILSGVVVAITSVLSAKGTARRKQTADMLFGARSDKELDTSYKRLRALHTATDDNVRAYAHPDKSGTDAVNEIRYGLNHWERISVGICEGIYDEEMLRQTNYTNVLRLFEHAEPFIKAIRINDGKDTYYQDLECMVKRWEKNPLKVKRPK
ncbi:DUF4760 domain-containing protein [Pseudomonas quasicaspiana]|uniref:DUF4760 domain-containing protein n=1 Tax=Pseudomonas quasicaspiana TaxID=2829821 RepID=UPI001E5EACCE|nr:DUF4760 domain-containing protein [Pseudomonas quasicaspiana]MCD5970781.1 DUF4760 domain-containing protein [Pseudomonas quasicaspiana]